MIYKIEDRETNRIPRAGAIRPFGQHPRLLTNEWAFDLGLFGIRIKYIRIYGGGGFRTTARFMAPVNFTELGGLLN